MKKLLQKLVLLIPVMILLNGMTAFADEPKTSTIPTDKLNQLTGDDCISKDDENKYIITIIEEPIITGDETGKTSEGFITRTCYRVTLLYQQDTDYTQAMAPAFMNKCPDIAESTGFPGKTTLYCKRVQVLLSTGGTNLINNYIAMIYRWAASIVGLIAVIVIVLSGMQIAISGGDSQAIDGAKKRIFQSIGGLAVLFLSGIILYSINPTFFTY